MDLSDPNTISIVDAGGVEVPIDGDTVTLEENRHYNVRVGPGQARARFGSVDLEPHGGEFALGLAHWVGENTLSVETRSGRVQLRVRVRPRAEKLTEVAWLALLRDLEEWLPALSVGVEAGRHGAVARGGLPAPLLCEALGPLLPSFEQALKRVIDEPRSRPAEDVEDVPLRKLRRVERETVAWAGRHPGAGAWLIPWKSDELRGPEPLFPRRQVFDSVDHPANRYVAWLCRRVIRLIRDTSGAISSMAAHGSSDARQWCAARASRLSRAADNIEHRYAQSFLSRIRAEPPSEAALLVVLDDPEYARVHRIGHHFLSPLFRLDDPSVRHSASVRPSFELYELWCLLALSRQFRARLPAWTWELRGVEKLLALSGTGSGAEIVGKSSSGLMRVEFNATFPGYLHRGSSARFSISGERRPDFVVSWRPTVGSGRWLVLDAKYRAGAANLANAFESVHIYRDALRDESLGGPCCAAALLAPARSSDTDAWYRAEFFEAHRCGIFELEPGDEHDTSCATWMCEQFGVIDAEQPNPAPRA